MPVTTAPQQLTSEICCFCGQVLEHEDPERVRIGVRWERAGDEVEQSWGAHRECLLERLHEQVKGQGPFFDAAPS